MISLASWLIVLFVIVGHLVLVRAMLNRGYELGLPQRLWQVIVGGLVVIAFAGPVVMLWRVGFRGAALLRGGAWADVPPAWMLYFAVCLAALLTGIGVLIGRAHFAHVAAQISSDAKVLDYTRTLPTPPPVTGAVGKLARLPGNQVFTVEVVEREIRVPRLPRQWDGISILHVTDLHMNGTPDRAFFEWASARCAELKCDIAVMTGDVMDRLSVLDWLPTTLGAIDAPLGRYFVLGNHDLHVAGDTMRAAMERIGWTSVAGRVIERGFREARLVIAGTEKPWAGALPPMDGAVAPSEFRLLLSHAPHLVHWAQRRQVDLVLAGHLHGGQIQWPVIGPLAGGRFHSGLFDLPPTLMHVGRGLGQMAPLRWGCRPEITKLVLRAAAHT
jgi:predicted MPP superfamily phosphohydrolase